MQAYIPVGVDSSLRWNDGGGSNQDAVLDTRRRQGYAFC